jgi:hypothetical protein
MGTISTSATIAKDERIDVGGMAGGQLAAPSALIVNPGGIGARAGDYSQISTTISGSKLGMTGAEVKDLLAQTSDAFKSTAAGVMDYARSAIASTQAAQTGELPNWQKYIPLGIGVIALFLIVRARK